MSASATARAPSASLDDELLDADSRTVTRVAEAVGPATVEV